MPSVSCAPPALCVALYNVPQLQRNEPTLKQLSSIRPYVTPVGRPGGNGDFCDGNTCQAADQLRHHLISQRSMNSQLVVMTDSCCHVPDQNNNLEVKGLKYRSLEPHSCFNFTYCKYLIFTLLLYIVCI